MSPAASLARRAAASSPSKANVPPLPPGRSSLVRWVTTKPGTPGHGVPPHAEVEGAPPDDAAPTVASTVRKPMSMPPSGPFPAVHIHSCSRPPPSPMGSAAPTFGPAVNPSRDIATSSTPCSSRASLDGEAGAVVRAEPAVLT